MGWKLGELFVLRFDVTMKRQTNSK